MTEQIKLGTKVRDRITGFTGIAVGKIEHINGCIQFIVRPKGKDGKTMPDAWNIDVDHLEIVSSGGVKIKKRDTGGSNSRFVG